MANNTFKRHVLTDEHQSQATELLQGTLVTLIDLALNLKQAHWNVVGPNFRSVHLQLDEILITVRDATDEIAERVVTIGLSPDGRASTVSKDSVLKDFPTGFHQVSETIAHVADQMKAAIDQLRSAIEKMGDIDPISEDLLIGISGQLEKHLWMVQAQEVQ
jgi:starvation-inducible DNA-binding protein